MFASWCNAAYLIYPQTNIYFIIIYIFDMYVWLKLSRLRSDSNPDFEHVDTNTVMTYIVLEIIGYPDSHLKKHPYLRLFKEPI